MNAPFRSAIAARSALAARALLCAFLAACAEPPVSQALDKYTCPADGGPCTLSPEFGVVQGSVVYQGTRRGDVVLLLFASNDLPPPDGTATAPVEIETLHGQVSQLADRPRFETALLGFFAFCGLLMAVIGLYGVIAFMAAQRTQEIGVRMALGATRVDILRLIAGEGLRLIVLGGVLGLGAALAAAQLLKSLLYNVGTHDPLVYAAVALLLAVVALMATLIPARAAMRVEPVEALRFE